MIRQNLIGLFIPYLFLSPHPLSSSTCHEHWHCLSVYPSGLPSVGCAWVSHRWRWMREGRERFLAWCALKGCWTLQVMGRWGWHPWRTPTCHSSFLPDSVMWLFFFKSMKTRKRCRWCWRCLSIGMQHLKICLTELLPGLNPASSASEQFFPWWYWCDSKKFKGWYLLD